MEIVGETKTTQIDTTGKSSASPLVQSVSHRTRGMPSCLIIIFLDIWTKDMTRLSMLEYKVHNI